MRSILQVVDARLGDGGKIRLSIVVACVVAPFLEWCGKDALGGAIGLDLIHIEGGWMVRVVWVEFNDCFLVLGRQIAHL